MIQKVCPHCLKNSYSAYDNPKWICPYCGADIGNKLIEKDELQKNTPKTEVLNARIIELGRRKQEGN